MGDIFEYKKINPNPNVEILFGFEAFRKWMMKEENILSLYNSGDVRGRFAESVIEQLEGSNTIIVDN